MHLNMELTRLLLIPLTLALAVAFLLSATCHCSAVSESIRGEYYKSTEKHARDIYRLQACYFDSWLLIGLREECANIETRSMSFECIRIPTRALWNYNIIVLVLWQKFIVATLDYIRWKGIIKKVSSFKNIVFIFIFFLLIRFFKCLWICKNNIYIYFILEEKEALIF